MDLFIIVAYATGNSILQRFHNNFKSRVLSDPKPDRQTDTENKTLQGNKDVLYCNRDSDLLRGTHGHSPRRIIISESFTAYSSKITKKNIPLCIDYGWVSSL